MFSSPRRIVGSGLLLVLTSLTAPSERALGETVFLQPDADTNLIETAPDNNLGGASYFNAGTAGNGNRNRALMRFDVASQVPVGALIQSITLSLDIVRQPSSDWQSTIFGLHRLNVSWGEGDKVSEEGSPGLGNIATTGDATWNFRFVGGPAWTVPGGQAGADFVSESSASTLVFGLGDPVIFEGSERMVADVQSWVDHPNQNFGWMLMTESEDVRKSARGFASRESGFGPQLTIEYIVVPEPGTGLLLAGGLIALVTWKTRRRLNDRNAAHP